MYQSSVIPDTFQGFNLFNKANAIAYRVISARSVAFPDIPSVLQGSSSDRKYF